MIAPIFAMAPNQNSLIGWGVLLTLVIAIVFVDATASGRHETNRRAGLGLLALLGGPLIGASLAGLAHALGHVRPADVTDTYVKFAGVGGIAGFLTGLAFALTCLLTWNEPEKKPEGNSTYERDLAGSIPGGNHPVPRRRVARPRGHPGASGCDD
jgi:hypothetical protein